MNARSSCRCPYTRDQPDPVATPACRFCLDHAPLTPCIACACALFTTLSPALSNFFSLVVFLSLGSSASLHMPATFMSATWTAWGQMHSISREHATSPPSTYRIMISSHSRRRCSRTCRPCRTSTHRHEVFGVNAVLPFYSVPIIICTKW